MSKKPAIPGIDEDALAGLARQFPATVVKIVKETEPPADRASPPARAEPPQAAQPEIPRPRRRGGRGLAFLALIVALVALGVSGTAVMPDRARLWIKERVSNPVAANALTGNRAELDATLASTAATLKGVQDREAALDVRVAAIEAVGGSSSAAATRIEAVEGGLRALTERLTETDLTVGGAIGQIGQLQAAVSKHDQDLQAFTDRIATLETDLKRSADATTEAFNPRLATIEGGLAGAAQDDRVTRFFLACQELRRLTQTSHPFEHELEAARGLAGDNPEVSAAFKTLAAYASVGVPTAAELRDDFSLVVAPSVLTVSGAGQKGVGARTVGWMRSWFTAPSVNTPGNRNAALVVQASRNLEKQQLGPAVEQALLLEDQAALIAADWLRSASARLAVDKATAVVMAQGFDRLAGPGR